LFCVRHGPRPNRDFGARLDGLREVTLHIEAPAHCDDDRSRTFKYVCSSTIEQLTLFLELSHGRMPVLPYFNLPNLRSLKLFVSESLLPRCSCGPESLPCAFAKHGADLVDGIASAQQAAALVLDRLGRAGCPLDDVLIALAQDEKFETESLKKK